MPTEPSPESFEPRFDLNRFVSELRQRGCALGEPVHYYAQTTSTNDEAKRGAALGATHGSLFVADSQSAGRGRRGKTWHADPNRHLLVSVLLRPRRPGSNPSALTLVVGVALHRALRPLLNPGCASGLGLKWPNDLEHDGRKVAGVLVEGQVEADGQFVAVVGFGVNMTPVVLPPTESARAVCLQELGVQLSRESVLPLILFELERCLYQFAQSGLATFVDYINENNALRGTTVNVEGTLGKVAAIGPGGQLILQTAHGLRNMTAGTVERARDVSG